MSDLLATLLAPYRKALSGDEVNMETDPVYAGLLEDVLPKSAPKVPANGDPVAIGKALARRYGWSGDQWRALYELWSRESGWNPQADNPTSSAFGIPQALTGTHDVSSAYLRGNPRAQIKWGLDYIDRRYGSPLEALAFHDSNNWY